MLGQAKYRRSFGCFVAADTLEHARTIVERVREDMDAGIIPFHKLAVLPDVVDRRLRHFLLLSPHMMVEG
jgi:hypothetical protein